MSHTGCRISSSARCIAPFERHEAGARPASPLGAVAPAALALRTARSPGLVGGAANRPRAGGDHTARDSRRRQSLHHTVSVLVPAVRAAYAFALPTANWLFVSISLPSLKVR